MKNEELIPLALAGDQDAYTQLFKNLKGIVTKTSTKFFRGQWLGIDFEADCYSHILMNLHKFKGTAKFSTWATRVAFNVALQMLRAAKAREGRNISIDLPISEDGTGVTYAETIPDTRNSFAAMEAKWDLDLILSKVHPKRRYFLIARRLDGVSLDELATSHGITLPSVKAYVHNGLMDAMKAAHKAA